MTTQSREIPLFMHIGVQGQKNTRRSEKNEQQKVEALIIKDGTFFQK